MSPSWMGTHKVKNGFIGRWRKYICIKCGSNFERLVSRPVPPGARICEECLKDPTNHAEFLIAYDKAEISEAVGSEGR